MRVLHINSVYKTGSTGRIVYDIHSELLKQGHESYVIFGRKSGANDKNAHRMTSTLGNYWHVLMSRLTGKHGLYNTLETKKLIKFIKEYKPSIIHLHNIHGYYLNYEVLFTFFKQTNIKVFWTLHDSWSYTGQCAYYLYKGCDKFKSECHRCPNVGEYPKTFKDSSNFNYFKKQECFTNLKGLEIITPSKWLKEEISASFLKNYQVTVINNGIDLNVFKKTETFKKSNPKIILGVANIWDKRKGIDYFLKLNDYIGSEYQIMLVGLNDNQIKTLPKNMIGIKRTNGIDELVKAYNEASVFFNPTLEDNYPTTNLEAQACGCPVITFNSGGTQETIKANNCKVVSSNTSIEDVINLIDIISKKETPLEINTDKLCKYYAISQYINIYKEGAK